MSRTNDQKPAKVLSCSRQAATGSKLFRAHTHFHTPQTFKNTNQFPSWSTVSPYLSQYPPDSRQRLSFSACAPHVFFNVSTHPVSKSSSFSFRKMNRQVRGSDRPKLANLSDNTTAHSSFEIAIRLPAFTVFGARCSRAAPINFQPST